ncbi:MAG: hypothetical protein FD129_1135 [bacterium]|nr:MAG: hypothetical protein FD129_1135 [bacterium]
MTMKYNALLTLSFSVLLLSAAASCQAETKGGAASGSTPATAAPPSATTGGKAAVGWNEAIGWDLFRGGVEDAEARIFQSPDFQKYLVIPSGTVEAIVLGLKSKEVTVLPTTMLVLTGDVVQISGPLLPAAVGTFTRTGSDLTFTASGAAWKLAPEPPLIGEIAKADLLNRKKDYVALARAYKPKSAAISLIRSVRQPIEIRVFFGTWCSHCKHYLPGFLKTIDMAANPAITVRYIGISEDMSQPEALLTADTVTRTPTFIALSGGREMGRIVEQPKGSIEEDLALLLMGAR